MAKTKTDTKPKRSEHPQSASTADPDRRPSTFNPQQASTTRLVEDRPVDGDLGRTAEDQVPVRGPAETFEVVAYHPSSGPHDATVVDRAVPEGGVFYAVIGVSEDTGARRVVEQRLVDFPVV